MHAASLGSKPLEPFVGERPPMRTDVDLDHYFALVVINGLADLAIHDRVVLVVRGVALFSDAAQLRLELVRIDDCDPRKSGLFKDGG